MESFNKDLFLEKVQPFIDKGIINIPNKKSYATGNVRFTFKYQIDKKFKLLKIMQHLYNKGFNVCFHNWKDCFLHVVIPESKEEDFDKLKYHKIIVSYPDNIVKQVSHTSFDKALEAVNTFLKALEDFKFEV